MAPLCPHHTYKYGAFLWLLLRNEKAATSFGVVVLATIVFSFYSESVRKTWKGRLHETEHFKSSFSNERALV